MKNLALFLKIYKISPLLNSPGMFGLIMKKASKFLNLLVHEAQADREWFDGRERLNSLTEEPGSFNCLVYGLDKCILQE